MTPPPWTPPAAHAEAPIAGRPSKRAAGRAHAACVVACALVLTVGATLVAACTTQGSPESAAPVSPAPSEGASAEATRPRVAPPPNNRRLLALNPRLDQHPTLGDVASAERLAARVERACMGYCERLESCARFVNTEGLVHMDPVGCRSRCAHDMEHQPDRTVALLIAEPTCAAALSAAYQCLASQRCDGLRDHGSAHPACEWHWSSTNDLCARALNRASLDDERTTPWPTRPASPPPSPPSAQQEDAAHAAPHREDSADEGALERDEGSAGSEGE